MWGPALALIPDLHILCILGQNVDYATLPINALWSWAHEMQKNLFVHVRTVGWYNGS